MVQWHTARAMRRCPALWLCLGAAHGTNSRVRWALWPALFLPSGPSTGAKPLPVVFHVSPLDGDEETQQTPPRRRAGTAAPPTRVIGCLGYGSNVVRLMSTGTQFRFARVLGPRASPEELFASAARHVASAVMDGTSGTVLAYGLPKSVRVPVMWRHPLRLVALSLCLCQRPCIIIDGPE